MNAALGELRQDLVQFAIADERLAADQGDVHRPLRVHEREHAVDELLALEIGDLAQRDVTAEVIVAVRVASRAAQRTFTRDFDRERRTVAGQNAAPCLYDPGRNRIHSTSLAGLPPNA